MSFYEIVLIARQDLSPAQADSVFAGVKDLISELKGSVEKEENWGLRQLAYKVKKNKKGYYFYMEVKLDAEQTFELERKLKLNEDIIRHFVLKIDGISQNDTLMMDAGTDGKFSKEICYKNVKFIKRSISERGRILPKRLTGLSSKNQRKLALAVKRARLLALVPFVANND